MKTTLPVLIAFIVAIFAAMILFSVILWSIILYLLHPSNDEKLNSVAFYYYLIAYILYIVCFGICRILAISEPESPFQNQEIITFWFYSKEKMGFKREIY